MSPKVESLVEELNEVKQRVIAQEQENQLLQKLINENRGPILEKYTKTVQFLIGLIVFVAGMGISWGVVTTKVSGITDNKTEISKVQERLSKIEIDQSVNVEIFRSIKEDINEIKEILKDQQEKSNARKQK